MNMYFDYFDRFVIEFVPVQNVLQYRKCEHHQKVNNAHSSFFHIYLQPFEGRQTDGIRVAGVLH